MRRGARDVALFWRVGAPFAARVTAVCLAGFDCRRRTRVCCSFSVRHAVSVKVSGVLHEYIECSVHSIGEMKAISLLMGLAVLVAVVCAGVKQAERTVRSDNLVAYGNSFIVERGVMKATLSQKLMFDCFTAVAKQGDDDDDDASAHFVVAANTNGFRICTTFEMLAIVQNQPTHHFPAGNASFVTFSSADGYDTSIMVIRDGAIYDEEEADFEEPGTFYAFCCSARLILGTVGEGDDK